VQVDIVAIEHRSEPTDPADQHRTFRWSETPGSPPPRRPPEEIKSYPAGMRAFGRRASNTGSARAVRRALLRWSRYSHRT
jgi:hypothetical protein